MNELRNNHVSEEDLRRIEREIDGAFVTHGSMIEELIKKNDDLNTKLYKNNEKIAYLMKEAKCTKLLFIVFCLIMIVIALVILGGIVS